MSIEYAGSGAYGTTPPHTIADGAHAGGTDATFTAK